eukprot:TRINITY_DN1142_c0_g1_i2.p1 TRINITY_DN1142_c0_g1~~TRINITY_DN1142_c0_g1_i2.p1  ORF type:complete len:408 (+),score=76.85 TRINITY_DN1142_c0_g1_i2:42-1226(+)
MGNGGIRRCKKQGSVPATSIFPRPHQAEAGSGAMGHMPPVLLMRNTGSAGKTGSVGSQGKKSTRQGTESIPKAVQPRQLCVQPASDNVTKASSSRVPREREPSEESSSLLWKSPEGTLIIVDWDDTLFPTSWISTKDWFQGWVRTRKWEGVASIPSEDRKSLNRLDTAARAFLLMADTVGQVSCVTLARRPWQEQSMKTFLPRLAETWQRLGVTVRYAQEERAVQAAEGVGSTVGFGESPEGYLLHKLLHARQKKKAMERELRKFYKEGSWKNVVSVGDSHAELVAIQEIGFRHDNQKSARSGDFKRFRIKTVKMLEEPSADELLTELELIQSGLPPLVAVDQDFDLVLDRGEEQILERYKLMLDLAELPSPRLQLPSPRVRAEVRQVSKPVWV